MDKRYQVFVSSTFIDLKEERNKVIQTLMKMNCIPAGMEMFNAVDDEQFNFIKRVIDDSDYYIVIIGGRYGSLTADGLSYTEKEYDYAIKKGIKVIGLLHGDPDSIPGNKLDMDPELRKKLQLFRDKVRTGRLVEFWKNADELSAMAVLSLQTTISMYPAVGWVRSDTISTDLYKDISQLQMENASLRALLHDVTLSDDLIGKYSFERLRNALAKKQIYLNGCNESALAIFKHYHASFIDNFYLFTNDNDLKVLVKKLCPLLLSLGLIDLDGSRYSINEHGNRFIALDFLNEN